MGMVGCAGAPTSNQADPFDSAMNAPPNPQTLFRLARILAAQGRDDECRHVLQDVNRRYPEFAPAYCDLAELHMRAGRTDEAGEVLERGIQACPRDARLAGNLGMCFMVKGDYTRALDAFNKAAALGTDDARHRSNMAVALGMLGRYEEALAEYEKVVGPATAHYNVGVLANARDDKVRAESEFALAYQMDPKLAVTPPLDAAAKQRTP
jgi:Flp pilus assembly protein TadD